MLYDLKACETLMPWIIFSGLEKNFSVFKPIYTWKVSLLISKMFVELPLKYFQIILKGNDALESNAVQVNILFKRLWID